MLHLSLKLILLLFAYLIYLFFPIPKLGSVNHENLHSSRLWAPGDLQIMKEYERGDQHASVYLTGSSVAASLFPNKKLLLHFDPTETRMLHLAFIKAQHLNALFGKGGVMQTPKNMVFFVGPDLLTNFSRFEDKNPFKFLRRHRALSWQLSFSSQLVGDQHFIANDDAMSYSLDKLKSKKTSKWIQQNAISFIKQARDSDRKLKLFEQELKEIQQLKRYLQHNNCQLMVVVLPIQKIMFDHRSPLKKNINRLHTTCEKSDIAFVDFSREAVNTDCFIDWGHYSSNTHKELDEVRKKIALWVNQAISK